MTRQAPSQQTLAVLCALSLSSFGNAVYAVSQESPSGESSARGDPPQYRSPIPLPSMPSPPSSGYVEFQTYSRRNEVLRTGFVVGFRVAAIPHVTMVGLSAAFRYRPTPHVGLDMGVGIYGGKDYQGLTRTEVPITGDVAYFVNPRDPIQIYFLVGLGGSFASVESNALSTASMTNSFYIGGEIGTGAEFRLKPSFALLLDVRGFLRRRMGSGVEFVERDADRQPTGRTSDTGGGTTVGGGCVFYFY